MVMFVVVCHTARAVISEMRAEGSLGPSIRRGWHERFGGTLVTKVLGELEIFKAVKAKRASTPRGTPYTVTFNGKDVQCKNLKATVPVATAAKIRDAKNGRLLVEKPEYLSDDDEPEVEKICGQRQITNHNPPRYHYEVKWKGWPADANTWETRGNLKHAPEALAKWEAKVKRNPSLIQRFTSNAADSSRQRTGTRRASGSATAPAAGERHDLRRARRKRRRSPTPEPDSDSESGSDEGGGESSDELVAGVDIRGGVPRAFASNRDCAN